MLRFNILPEKNKDLVVSERKKYFLAWDEPAVFKTFFLVILWITSKNGCQYSFDRKMVTTVFLKILDNLFQKVSSNLWKRHICLQKISSLDQTLCSTGSIRIYFFGCLFWDDKWRNEIQFQFFLKWNYVRNSIQKSIFFLPKVSHYRSGSRVVIICSLRVRALEFIKREQNYSECPT